MMSEVFEFNGAAGAQHYNLNPGTSREPSQSDYTIKQFAL